MFTTIQNCEHVYFPLLFLVTVLIGGSLELCGLLMNFWPVVLEGDVDSMHEFMYRSCTQGGPLYSGRDRASEKKL